MNKSTLRNVSAECVVSVLDGFQRDGTQGSDNLLGVITLISTVVALHVGVFAFTPYNGDNWRA